MKPSRQLAPTSSQSQPLRFESRSNLEAALRQHVFGDGGFSLIAFRYKGSNSGIKESHSKVSTGGVGAGALGCAPAARPLRPPRAPPRNYSEIVSLGASGEPFGVAPVEDPCMGPYRDPYRDPHGIHIGIHIGSM